MFNKFPAKSIQSCRRKLDLLEYTRLDYKSANGPRNSGMSASLVGNSAFALVVPLHERDEAVAKDVMRGLIDDALYFMYGIWRTTGTLQILENDEKLLYTEESARESPFWVESFLAGSVCALCLGDTESLKRISAYLLDEKTLPTKDFLDEHERANAKMLYVGLARMIHGQALGFDRQTPWVEKRAAGQRVKRMRECVHALAERDLPGIDQALTKLLEYHIKPKRDQVSEDYASFDGSLIYHLTRLWCGRSPVVDKKLLDPIVLPFEEWPAN